MQLNPKLNLGRFALLFSRIAREQRALAMIETALVLPVLLLLGLGGIELAHMVLTYSRISQMGLNVADNASRIGGDTSLPLPHVRESDLTEVFTAADLQNPNLNFSANGRIILTSLERNSNGGQWLHWQRCYGSLARTSSYGVEGNGRTGTSITGMGPTGQQIAAPAGVGVMFVEIFYERRPLIFSSLFGTRVIRYTSAFTVREARDYDEGVKLRQTGASPLYPCST